MSDLIERLERAASAFSDEAHALYGEAAARIKQLEGEHRRLTDEAKEDADVVARHAARIKELEAEIERLQNLVECKDCMEYAHRVRDAIEAATIEECVAAAYNACVGPPSGWENGKPKGWRLDRPCTVEEAAHHDSGCISAAKAIRALKPAVEERKE